MEMFLKTDKSAQEAALRKSTTIHSDDGLALFATQINEH